MVGAGSPGIIYFVKEAGSFQLDNFAHMRAGSTLEPGSVPARGARHHAPVVENAGAAALAPRAFRCEGKRCSSGRHRITSTTPSPYPPTPLHERPASDTCVSGRIIFPRSGLR